MELFWNSLDNAPSSIVFYLEMKVEVEVGVHDIRSQLTPRFGLNETKSLSKQELDGDIFKIPNLGGFNRNSLT